MMDFKFPWQTKSKNKFEEIETILSKVLTPVSMRPGFQDELHHRLNMLRVSPVSLDTPEPVVKKEYALIGLAGIAGALFVLVTGFRTLAGVWGAFELLSHFYQQLKRKKTFPPMTPSL
jgi:hypothetical protein